MPRGTVAVLVQVLRTPYNHAPVYRVSLFKAAYVCVFTLHYTTAQTRKQPTCQQPKEDQHYITLHYSPDMKTAHLLAAHRNQHYITLHYTTLQSEYKINPPASSPQKINITLHYITLNYSPDNKTAHLPAVHRGSRWSLW